jgi:hypothetical protein
LRSNHCPGVPVQSKTILILRGVILSQLSPSARPLSRLLVSRAELRVSGPACRVVYVSNFLTRSDGLVLADYVADRAPLFYRKLEHVIADLNAGTFLSAFRDTLAKLPTAESFQESHFGEIVAGLFAEELGGFRRLYSKLSLLTAENSNAYKMDLVLCKPLSTPLEFIFGEVKSSCKAASDGLPAGHDKSCYAALFDSFNKYEEADLEFDLTAARDNLERLGETEAERVREALLPYGARAVSYAGFVVIDSSTHSAEESRVLATRENKKEFDVELICIESLKGTIDAAYTQLRKAGK